MGKKKLRIENSLAEDVTNACIYYTGNFSDEVLRRSINKFIDTELIELNPFLYHHYVNLSLRPPAHTYSRAMGQKAPKYVAFIKNRYLIDLLKEYIKKFIQETKQLPEKKNTLNEEFPNQKIIKPTKVIIQKRREKPQKDNTKSKKNIPSIESMKTILVTFHGPYISNIKKQPRFDFVTFRLLNQSDSKKYINYKFVTVFNTNEGGRKHRMVFNENLDNLLCLERKKTFEVTISTKDIDLDRLPDNVLRDTCEIMLSVYMSHGVTFRSDSALFLMNPIITNDMIVKNDYIISMNS